MTATRAGRRSVRRWTQRKAQIPVVQVPPSWLVSVDCIEMVSGVFGVAAMDRLILAAASVDRSTRSWRRCDNARARPRRSRRRRCAVGVDIAGDLEREGAGREPRRRVCNVSFLVADVVAEGLAASSNAACSPVRARCSSPLPSPRSPDHPASAGRRRASRSCWDDLFADEWMFLPGSRRPDPSGGRLRAARSAANRAVLARRPGSLHAVLTQAASQTSRVTPHAHPVCCPRPKSSGWCSSATGPAQSAGVADGRCGDVDEHHRRVRSVFERPCRERHGHLSVAAHIVHADV